MTLQLEIHLSHILLRFLIDHYSVLVVGCNDGDTIISLVRVGDAMANLVQMISNQHRFHLKSICHYVD